jgi:hypothetical protein
MCGNDAYFHGGVDVLPGKPTRLTNGMLVPNIPDIVTGFGTFVICVFGPTLLLVFILRGFEFYIGRHKKNDG